jgi:hypothetical protein
MYTRQSSIPSLTAWRMCSSTIARIGTDTFSVYRSHMLTHRFLMLFIAALQLVDGCVVDACKVPIETGTRDATATLLLDCFLSR